MALMPAKAGHTAGIFADMSLDGPEIGTLVAVIDRARNLPNRKTMGKQDPYCAMRLGKEAKKTETDRRGGQTPKWDQELRFTVYDSPDYYRIKCSVFSDDKKTDMIGETFIELKDLIVPGGGQNDLWHQLQFKGKYAGEVRVEMTYYDSRPQEETLSMKKKERGHSTRESSPAVGTTVGPRQLGPREVKRRPLPAGPGVSSPAQANTPESNKPSRDLQSHKYPTPIATQNQEQYLPDQSYPIANDAPYTPTHVSEQSLPQIHDYMPAPRYPISVRTDVDFLQQEEPFGSDPGQFQPNHRSFEDYSTAPAPATYQDGHENEGWRPTPPSQLRNHPVSSPQPLTSSPPCWSSPNSIPFSQPTDYRHQSPNRQSISPIKPQYRDSPLRNSMNPYDVPENSYRNQDLILNEDDLPPLPPAHRDHAPRTVPNSEYETNRWAPVPRDTNSVFNHSMTEYRSPLQTIERNFDPTYHSSPLTASPTSIRQDNYPLQPLPLPNRGSQDHEIFDHRSSAGSNRNFPGSRKSGSSIGGESEPFSYYTGVRNFPPNVGIQDPYSNSEPRGRPVSFANLASNGAQIYRSDPPIVRPRAISPNMQPVSNRSSTNARSQFYDEPTEIESLPFGPDSYEKLNPGSSPVPVINRVSGGESFEEANELARQQEVQNLRDQGPIIGNDGRIIDPSDHLPADTWAPEPERKTRKPEHVIRFKTKEDSRGTGSSPVSVRPLSIATTSFPSPSTIANNSSPSVSPVKTGRNRLQKQSPIRPLPIQPFQHAHSSPAVTTMSEQHLPTTPTSQQRMMRPEFPIQTHYSTPSPQTGVRSRSTPTTNDMFTNRGSYSSYDTNRQFAPRTSIYDSPQYDDNRNISMDPLSAELSTIDIGPSRGGRTVARFSRGSGM